MDEMSTSMVEMDKKYAQLDDLFATVGQMHLGLSHQNASKSRWTWRIAFIHAFSAFLCLVSLCSPARSCVLERTFIFYTSCAFLLFFSLFYIYLRTIFAFIYLPCAFLFFIFYLLSPMRSLVLSSVRETGYLCFVCCFSAYSPVCAFFSCFLFSFFTKALFLLSPPSSFSPFN